MYLDHRAEAQIDLDAVLYNLQLMQEALPAQVKTVAVIKADGYGHGALPIARMLEKVDFIFGYAVATVDEGITLRKGGIGKPVMLLGYAFPEQYEAAVLNDLWLVVFHEETAARIAQTAEKLGKTANIQIAVDTGMNRIGYRVNPENADEIARICRMPCLSLQGVFTHFFASDETDKTRAKAQRRAFEVMKGYLEARGIAVPYYHCSNSAAMIDLPDLSMDLVRAGIAMYGLTPSDEVRPIGLHPAMTLKARIAEVKTVPSGETISYGGTYTLPEDQRIATISFGYADGYPRGLSNTGYVLVHGKRSPIRGRVCMDQFMVDVTQIPQTKVGDEVTLVGKDEDARITIEELSALCGRFNYEFACCISKRVPRVYLENGHLHGNEIMI